MVRNKISNTTAAFLIVSAITLLVFLFSNYALKIKDSPSQTNFEKVFGMTLKDYEGNDVHLYDFRRKVLVAYAWASWCTYCGAELKNLGTLKGKYGDSVRIIAVNRAEALPTAKEFTDKLEGVGDIRFLLDPSDSFFKAIGGYAMPETVFINGKGGIDFHQRGPLKFEEVSQKMEELLK